LLVFWIQGNTHLENLVWQKILFYFLKYLKYLCIIAMDRYRFYISYRQSLLKWDSYSNMIQTHRLVECQWRGMWCGVKQDKVFLSFFTRSGTVREEVLDYRWPNKMCLTVSLVVCTRDGLTYGGKSSCKGWEGSKHE
jgi:hypothetical protein